MFNDEVTLHVSLISMKTRSADQLKKRTFITFMLFIITLPSSLSLMFNITTFNSIQIYTTLLSALSLTFTFSHFFNDLKTILGLLTLLIAAFQHYSSSLQTLQSSSSFSSSLQTSQSSSSSSSSFLQTLQF